jgi:molybdate transport system substrate-binding protein
MDNYGAAAAEVLASPPWRIAKSSIPSALVLTRSSVGVAFSSVKRGSIAYGFVAKSEICQFQNGTYTYIDGFPHEYKPLDFPHPYNPLLLKLTGIELARAGRTKDQATELANFVSFLTGTRDSFHTATSNGTSLIQGYCFQLPLLEELLGR